MKHYLHSHLFTIIYTYLNVCMDGHGYVYIQCLEANKPAYGLINFLCIDQLHKCMLNLAYLLYVRMLHTCSLNV